ncbi:MAG: LysE/ArgO family amino acid transporter [Thermomicrobiales bacterium]
MSIYLAGLLLGLGLIFPIGPLNLFVVGQGLRLGMPRALSTVVLVGLNDTVMIAAGALLGTVAATAVTGLRLPLLLLGATYLTWLGVRALRAKTSALETVHPAPLTLWRTAAISCGVVWLNPHAILDAFGVLGTAIASRAAGDQLAFGAGVISASWVWYLGIASGAGWMRTRMTTVHARWFDRVSAVLLLGFAGVFWTEVAGRFW